MFRRRFFQLTTLAVIAFTIFGALAQRNMAKKLGNTSESTSSFSSSLEEKAFSMQSKLILSLIELVNSQNSISDVDKQKTKQSLVNSSKAFLEYSDKDKKFLKIKKIIFSRHLGLPIKKLCSNNKHQLTKDICDNKTLEISEEENKRLSWFFKLHQKKKALDKKALNKFGLGFVILILVLSTSFFTFLFYTFYFTFKKPKFEFKQSIINSDYCLEIFCLYLLGMNLLPFLLLRIDYDPLKLNVISIFSLTTLVFWPVFFKQKFIDIKNSLGLSLKKLPKDFLIGVFSYLAAIIPLLVVLSLYSVLLAKLGVNVEQGAHPVVPIITQSKDNTIIYLIFVLAVVVAPIVEEVMFRGAFYSWLRDRLNAPLSILISSLVFAAIHPQGAIGIVPLTFIGAVLAILREWRGSITACIFTHACFNAGTLLLVVSAFK